MGSNCSGSRGFVCKPSLLGNESFEVWERVKSGVASCLEKKAIKCAIHRSKCIILWLRSWFCRLHNFLKTLSRVLSEIAQPDVTDGQPSVPTGFQISRASLLLSTGSLCGRGVSELYEPSDFSVWGKGRLKKIDARSTSQVNVSELNTSIPHILWVSWSGADCKRLMWSLVSPVQIGGFPSCTGNSPLCSIAALWALGTSLDWNFSALLSR